MWIIHKGNRKKIYNLDWFQTVDLRDNFILMKEDMSYDDYEDTVALRFETDDEAKAAFGYLIEALKRGDKIIHI